MRLSIITPVYNEKGTLTEVVRKIQKTDIGLPKELIIVDDCSTDGTRELLRSAEFQIAPGGSTTLTVIEHERNRGKGAAVRTGISQATGDIILIQDADLEYDPDDWPQLLAPLLQGRADVVFGNRFHGGSHRVLYFWHAVGNRVLTTLSNMLSNLNLNDMEVGYKLFRREVLQRIVLKSERFGFEPEVTMKVARLGYRIYEVPISYHGRTYAEGKKITWKDGVSAIFSLLQYRFANLTPELAKEDAFLRPAPAGLDRVPILEQSRSAKESF
jgi:glycosyltransferase involved in cell wall biosynthesis